MQIKTLNIFVHISVLFSAAVCFAAAPVDCGNGQPAKHRVVIVWNGENYYGQNLKYFDRSVQTAVKTLGIGASKQYLALGGVYEGTFKDQKGKFIPAWRPDPLPSNTSIFEATPTDLAAIFRDISKEFETKKKGDPNFVASDFEVVFVVTNHGGESSGKSGKTYSIVGSPLSGARDDKNTSTNIETSQLTELGRNLPAGIRVKTIFGQCFGSDTQKAFLDGVQAKGNKCACGASHAEFGRTAGGVMSAKSDFNWESNVLTNLAKGISLGEATATLSFPDAYGEGNNKIITSNTSDLLLFDTLLREKKFTDIPSGPTESMTYTPANFVKRADRLVGDSRLLNPSELAPRDRQLLEARSILIAKFIKNFYPNSSDESLISMAKEFLKIQELPFLPKDLVSTKLGELGESSTDQDPKEIVELVAKFVNQQKLLEAFLRVASDDTKEKYFSLRACEADPLLPVPSKNSALPHVKDSGSEFKGKDQKSQPNRVIQ